MEADGELFLTAAARVLDVSGAFVERLCDQGLLRCRRPVGGGDWMVRASDVADVQAERARRRAGAATMREVLGET